MAVCQACSAVQPDEARFCASCGSELAPPTCHACDAPLLPGARFCSSCGLAQGNAPATPPAAHPVAHHAVSSRRMTSVLFGDLVGFTALSESRDQEETRELLTRYFEECSQIVTRYGGTVEKFIGDAVMAVWGVPTAHEDDAERAVRAGLELVAKASAMGEDLGVAELAMRVGIVTGEVAVTIGAEGQGMVAGDVVNTASRVQTVADPDQVWVDETTRLLSSSAITYLDRGSHRLRGKADPVPLWSAQAVVASVGGAQRADGLEAPLVGRDRELRIVKELFHSVEESRRPALLVMVGEPGVGKSRIGWEFEKYVDGLTATTRWHSGRCVAYGEGLAFFALAEAIRPRLSSLLRSDDETTEISAAEQARLLELGLETYVADPREREWLLPRMGALLGVGSVGSFPREDLFSAWSVFLERVGGEDPVVLLIDDAHHADDGLVRFIEHLLAAASFPCFVMLMGRPQLLEEHPGLATNQRAAVSHLAALPDPEIAALLDGLVVGLPDDVRAALVERSEGVPLFAVETVRALIDRDLVVPRGGQYVLADPGLDLDTIGAPASLQALIAARLDALHPAQRSLVERASVIGNSFSREDIAELCDDLEGVDELLAGLVRQQILSQMSSRFSAERGQFQFVQSVVRQVAYATLSRRDRRALHLAVAVQTEAMDDAAGDLAPVIAQHYLSAVNALPSEPDVSELQARAIEQLERAAARARSLGALSESANHLLAALELSLDDTARARVQSGAAWALLDSGEVDQAIPHAVGAAAGYDRAGDQVAAGLAAAAHGMALYELGDNAGCQAVVQPRYDALLERPGAELALVALTRVLSQVTFEPALRRDLLDRRIQLAERLGDREELADSFLSLAAAYSTSGANETSNMLLSAAADVARTEHFPGVLSRCLVNLTVSYILEDLGLAVTTATEGVAVGGRTGVARWRAYAGLNLMLALMSAGRWEELPDATAAIGTTSVLTQTTAPAVAGFVAVTRGEAFSLPWGEQEAPQSDDLSHASWMSMTCAFAAQAEGDLDLALAHAVTATDTAYELARLSDDFVHMWPVAVDLALRVGDTTQVSRLLAIVDEAVSWTRIPPAIAAHRHRFAGLQTLDTDSEAAERSFRAAVDGFTRWGSAHYRARALAELGQLLSRTGRAAEGEPLVAEGRATLTGLGAQAWLEELRLAEQRTR